MTVAVDVHERCIGTFCHWSSSMLGVHHHLIIVNKLLGKEQQPTEVYVDAERRIGRSAGIAHFAGDARNHF